MISDAIHSTDDDGAINELESPNINWLSLTYDRDEWRQASRWQCSATHPIAITLLIMRLSLRVHGYTDAHFLNRSTFGIAMMHE